MSLQHAILVLLESESASGYDLLKRFNGSMGYFWKASHQQIYQQLKKMHQAGLIDCELQTQPRRPDRKVYSITARGLEHLIEWLAQPAKPFSYNDALLVKIFGGHLISTDELLEDMHRHRAIYQGRLDTFLSIEKRMQSMPPEERQRWKLPYLTLRRGILEVRAWLQWADEVDSELNGIEASEGQEQQA